MIAKRDALADDEAYGIVAEVMRGWSVPTIGMYAALVRAGYRAARAAPAQGEPRHLPGDEQQMLGRALRASAREVTAQGEPPKTTMDYGMYCPPLDGAAQGELQTEYQAGWDNCYAMAEPAIAALRAERDEAHSAVDAWIDLLRATEAERDALRAECADLRRRLDEHIDDKERALRLSAKESTRLTTEVERLRERVRVLLGVVEAADEYHQYIHTTGDWSGLQGRHLFKAIDAARAKVQP